MSEEDEMRTWLEEWEENQGNNSWDPNSILALYFA